MKIVCLIIILIIVLLSITLNMKESKNKEYRKDGNSTFEKKTVYERYIKRLLDIVISLIGIILTFPFVLVSSVLIFCEDPGNVIFTQKRVGIHKTYFDIHKLRSMRKNTGDIPTHLLSQEDQARMILKIGKIIRKTSIDEFPQFVDIFRGKMSLVGPRPALWNQFDLIAERDKYGANDIKPGLTGWAQVNGRDSISIEEKARLDGVYKECMRKSSLDGIKMDINCFLYSIKSVLTSDGVIEGGTGSMKKGTRNYLDDVSNEMLKGNIGFNQKVDVDKNVKKRVLITGKNSYIGSSFKNYVNKYYRDNFEIDELNMHGDTWKNYDFSKYDIVFHVAGIAHADVGNVSLDTKELYYSVNSDLAIATAKKAKESGVKNFILMSSMIVYGDSAPFGKKKVIDATTIPSPANYYGDSKLQGEVKVRQLANNQFHVIVLRPPMIYGKNSKGNYRTLAKLAKKLPIFPNVENERSMLYIDNLCEFLTQVMLISNNGQEATVLIPQNQEWVQTTEMVKEIASASNHKIYITKLINFCVILASVIPGKIKGLVNKAFGNNCYEHSISYYEGLEYQLINLKESIYQTEGEKR